MSDQELIKLAAKAAGIELMQGITEDRLLNSANRNYWNPLNQDGDAFYLLVKLNINVCFGANYIILDEVQYPTVNNANDTFAAARRAIVIAAAERETAKRKHEWVEQPDLARVGEVGVWGDGQALEEPANSTTDFVEPVAWIEKDKDYLAVSADPFENAIPVYTAPPKREWVGLTDEERLEVASRKWWHWEDAFDIGGFARAIEAKLKEKNT